ncbi:MULTISPECIES: hypothetical protein [Bradyrhizobium]|uniref:hypothetical protein n=1 Tax=Bradyrhizobium TaxID=374 RepID=UPI0011B25668|nr:MULTISPECIES: hypothetical protein [Bradyrhizobium]MCA1414640.1 hypothetical protein [Bradyrhizobium sp. NBAIM20]MCA1465748.1 hypothetical protein [Bradyrhizobium sp. NBAIM18]MCA1530379.1 hypothetical protein [Bradyrhizobium yuanmingense]
MPNVVEFRRPSAPVRATLEAAETTVLGKCDTPVVPFPMACDSGRCANPNPRLKSIQANAKLTIDHAIATLEQTHRQIRAAIQKIGDASAGANLETSLDLIERNLELAKLKSSCL